MMNNNDELLSALADDELSQGEMDSLVEKLASDPELQARWRSYYVISDTLNNELTTGIDPGFHRKVSAAIADEPTVLAPRRWRKVLPDDWLRQAAGLGIAASVTAVAILGVQHLNQEPDATMAKTPSADRYIRIATPSVKPEKSDKKDFLEHYLVNHNEYSAASGTHGVLPYARIVSDQRHHQIAVNRPCMNFVIVADIIPVDFFMAVMPTDARHTSTVGHSHAHPPQHCRQPGILSVVDRPAVVILVEIA